MLLHRAGPLWKLRFQGSPLQRSKPARHIICTGDASLTSHASHTLISLSSFLQCSLHVMPEK